MRRLWRTSCSNATSVPALTRTTASAITISIKRADDAMFGSAGRSGKCSGGLHQHRQKMRGLRSRCRQQTSRQIALPFEQHVHVDPMLPGQLRDRNARLTRLLGQPFLEIDRIIWASFTIVRAANSIQRSSHQKSNGNYFRRVSELGTDGAGKTLTLKTPRWTRQVVAKSLIKMNFDSFRD